MKNNSKPFLQSPQLFPKLQLNFQSLLSKKYSCPENTYTYISTNYLLFNEKSRIVSKFKDYLIYDDSTEFLRRFYNSTESFPRLNRILTFYETYSKIFPNYMILPESEHLYKNIRKKQKMIDAKNAIKLEEEENRKKIAKTFKSSIEAYQSNCNTVFTQKIQKSILKYQPSTLTINDQTITESSISINLMLKKYVPNFDNSFANDDFREGLKTMNANENSIAEIIGVLNGENSNCIINVNQKKIINENMLMTTEQTPKRAKKTINYFQSEAIANKNIINMLYGNRTSKNVKGKVIRKMAMSPSSKGNTIEQSHNKNKIPLAKPVNNLKIITNNYQNIIIPQVNSIGGNTVININNNYYTCTDGQTETKEMKRIQSLSPKQLKTASSISKKSKTNPALFSPKAATWQRGSRSIQREKTSPLKSFNASDKRYQMIQTDRIKTFDNKNKSKKTDNSNNTNNTHITTNINTTNLQKSIGKSSRQNSKSGQTRRVKAKNTNTNFNLNNYNKVNSNYTLSQMMSPKRERELSKEKELTSEIRHKFKVFIEKSKMNPLTNRGLSDSFAPKNSLNTNRFSSNITTKNNSMQRTQINNHSQKKLNIESNNNQIKVISSVTQRLMSPLANSVYTIDGFDGNVPKIKVNTKPFLERNLSNGFMIMSNMQRNLNAESN